MPTRQISYSLNSYLCKKGEINKVFEWTKKQSLREFWFPDVTDFHTVFIGEFHWSPAFNHGNYNDWTDEDGKIPRKILQTTGYYYWEGSGYDCSVDDFIRIRLPSKQIVEGMNLRWLGHGGELVNEHDDLTTFDPTVRTSGPGALLVNKQEFLRFLLENEYEMFWTVSGEKIIIGDRTRIGSWTGRLEISGVYKTSEGVVEGALKARFVP